MPKLVYQEYTLFYIHFCFPAVAMYKNVVCVVIKRSLTIIWLAGGSYEPSFPHRVKLIAVKDDVVNDFNAQNLACFRYVVCDFNVRV